MRVVVALGTDGMGRGDEVLGQKLLGTFLRKAGANQGLSAIVMFNTGVRLAAEGSPLLGELSALREQGVDIRPCGTCLEYFGLQDKVKVGGVSSMDEIIDELNKAEKVISL